MRHIAYGFRTGEAAEGVTPRTGLWGTSMFKEVLVGYKSEHDIVDFGEKEVMRGHGARELRVRKMSSSSTES